ncbi:MAG TPA: class II histone deacetylase, partial [Ktedonobacteraceae bacterium]|nr:class II histone deacetylase [Ktedonobacteraceae bacterium]
MPAHSTGLVFDERFLHHDTGVEATVVTRTGSFQIDPESHPSSTQITRRIKQFLDGAGLTARMVPIAVRAASEEELLAYHTREYIAGVRAHVNGGPASGDWGEIESDTPLSAGSFEAALYAAGGALEATRAVLAGEVKNAYALLRPPGHHALSNRCMGYCIFNNAVLAAHYARRAYGLERIMIVDWDVHHGNGTQDAFYSDPGVLFVSLHQHNWYPRLSGELEQVGSGAGAGYTVNIPLPAGTGDRGYRAAFEQLVVPIGQQYRPQLIIISAGQDPSWLDPLAQMMLTMDGFRAMSGLLVDLAEGVCDGRLVMLQEGGYSAAYVPYCTAGAIEPLLGVDLGIVDLYDTSSERERSMTILTLATRDALTEARAWHKHWWRNI